MATCETFRDRMLDFVYGLLDETEAQDLRAHLVVCDECRDELTAVQREQRLFARAALPIQEVPVFQAPGADHALAAGPPPATRTLPFPEAEQPTARRPRRRFWPAYAAAAAVLVATGALWTVHQQRLGNAHAELALARRQVQDLTARRAALDVELDKVRQEVVQKARESLHLRVEGPAQYVPSVANSIRLTTRDLEGNPVAANANLRLLDEAGKELHGQTVATEKGAAVVQLPAGLPANRAVRLVVHAKADGAEAKVEERLPVAAPGYVTHLATNKASYQVGDVLFFRALALERATLKPPADPVPLEVALADAKGRVVASARTHTGPGGVASGELAVTEQLANGPYRLRVGAAPQSAGRVDADVRRLDVVRDAVFEVELDRDRVRPGEQLNFDVARSFGAAPGGMPGGGGQLRANVLVNGKPVPVTEAPAGAGPGGPGLTAQQFGASRGGGFAGGANPGNTSNASQNQLSQNAANYERGNNLSQRFHFEVPRDLQTPTANVKIVLTDGKLKETIEQDLPVVTARLSVDFYPEGGDLVAGVQNRVYYRVRDARGDTVRPEGRVIVLSSDEVLLDSDSRQATGHFTLVPDAGKTYAVRLTAADGGITELPDAFRNVTIKPHGVALHVPDAVGTEGEPVQVVLRGSGPARRALVTAQCRGQLVAHEWVQAGAGETLVTLRPAAGAHGLLRVAAHEAAADGTTPLAERLVYRAPAGRLELGAVNLGAVVAPGTGQRNVQLDLRARGEGGRPADAWLLAAVVDDRVRPAEPGLASHFYFLGDVPAADGLDDATLVARDDPEARQALDLFLGTYGWRRVSAAPRDGAAVARADAPAYFSRENESLSSLRRSYEEKFAQGIAAARQSLAARAAELDDASKVASVEAGRLSEAVGALEELPRTVLRTGLGVVTVLLLVAAVLLILGGVVGLVRRRHGTPAFAGAFACLAVCLGLTALLSGGALAPDAVPQGPFAQVDGNDGAKRARTFPEADRPPPLAAPPATPPVGEFALRQESVELAQRSRAVEEQKKATEARDESDLLMRPNDRAAGRGQAQSPSRPQKDMVAMRNAQRPGQPPDLARRYETARQLQAEQRVAVGPAPPQVEGAAPTSAGPGGAPGAGSPAPTPPGPAASAVPMAKAIAAAKKGKGGTESLTAPRAAPELQRMADAKSEQRDDKKKNDSGSPQGTVREYPYAYHHAPGLRHDTLLWLPSLHVAGGSAQVSFDVPDVPGSYRVLLLGHDAAGRFGYYEGRLEVQPTAR